MLSPENWLHYSGPPLGKHDVQLHLAISLSLVGFAETEDKPWLDIWVSYFQSQTACNLRLEEEPRISQDRTTRSQNIGIHFDTTTLPTDCTLEFDLTTEIPNPDLTRLRCRIVSGRASIYLSELLAFKHAHVPMEIDIVYGKRKKPITRAKMTIMHLQEPYQREGIEIITHPFFNKETLRVLMKKYKYAPLYLFENFTDGGIKGWREECKRMHTLSWKSRWGIDVPTEMYFTDSARGSRALGQPFFLRALEIVLEYRRYDAAEISQALDSLIQDGEIPCQDGLSKACVVLASLSVCVAGCIAYVSDVFLTRDGKVVERDVYSDIFTTRNGDCDEFGRLTVWILGELRRATNFTDPLLIKFKILANLYFEQGVNGTVSANKAGARAKMAYNCHM